MLFPVIFAFSRFVWEYAPDIFVLFALCKKLNAKPTLHSVEYVQLRKCRR
uniref:Uncharacterized protein n=1 Tax=Setaria italica TaxID=4555 RepID=K3YFQ8_SETIT